MILCAVFAAVMAVGAYIQIPVPPVSITLQTAVCVFAGCLLGARAGAVSMALYVLVGLIGVPVFTGGGGFAYVLKPSFGFLLGFIPAAFVTGLLFEKKIKKNARFVNVLLVSLAGVAALDVIGYPYMYFILRGASMPGPAAASVLSSILLFLPGDVLKCALVALVAPVVIKRLGSAYSTR